MHSLYNAVMTSFFFGFFCCFALNPLKKKNAAINFSCHVVMKRNKAKQQQTELLGYATMQQVVLYVLLCCDQ